MSGAVPPQRPHAARGGDGGGVRPSVYTQGPPGPSTAPRGRRPKDIGTEAETAVVRYLRDNGWPHAERRALSGAKDLGDITGCPALVWEVKGGAAAKSAGPKDVDRWLDETETERLNASADIGILVKARAGYGVRRVGMWWAVVPLMVVVAEPAPELEAEHAWMTMDTAVRWLHWTGYGGRPHV